MAKYIESQFYCINCGERGLDCLRKIGKKKGAAHRKKMYCPSCRQIVNHYEVHTKEEAEEFKQRYKNGDFIEEAKASIEYSKKDDWWCFK